MPLFERPDPPEDLKSEQKLLGAAILAPSSIPAIMGAVQPDDFYHPGTRLAFSTICDLSLAGTPVSVSTIAKEADCDSATLAEYTVGADGSEADFWAAEVRRYSRRRHLLAVGLQAADLAYSGEDPELSLGKVQSLLAEESVDALGLQSVEDGIDRVLERLKRLSASSTSLTGIPTGWEWLDEVLDGLKEGTVITVYAPTSQFKSWFVQNIAWMLSGQGYPGLMFTTEMPQDQVLQRLIQLESGVNIKRTRDRGELPMYMARLEEAAAALKEAPLYFSDRSVLDVGYLAALVLRAKQVADIKYVVVDLVDHVTSDRFRENQVKNEAFIMQQMKDIAKRCGITVICTTHIRKQEIEVRKQRRPVIDLEDMKGSSAKGQDADVAISLVQVARDPKNDDKWLAMTREQRVQVSRDRWTYLMAGVTKNRDAELADIVFEVDLDAGARMEPRFRD